MHTPRIICIIDGMADLPYPNGQPTPLAAAHTPWMDRLAAEGMAGLCRVIPPGAEAGSDTGIPALLGYDPLRHPVARGPLEALAAGMALGPHDLAWRCNVVALDGAGRMLHPAALMDAPTEHAVAHAVGNALAGPGYAVSHSGGFRFTVVERSVSAVTPPPTPAPQDVTGQTPASALLALAACRPDLHARITQANAQLAGLAPRGGEPDNTEEAHRLALWPWGCGLAPDIPPFSGHSVGWAGDRTGAAMIAAVPLARGMALAAGMAAPEIAGATGGPDTNLAAKAAAALTLLASHATVFVHVEGPDMCAHARDARAKAAMLTRVDAELVAPLRRARPDAVLCVTCDHVTHCGDGRHHAAPVPFLLHGPGIARAPSANPVGRFDEAGCAASGLLVPSAAALLRMMQAPLPAPARAS